MNVPDTAATRRYALGFYRRHPVASHLLLIVITAVFLLLLGLLWLNVWTAHGQTATVPDIKGQTYANAQSILEEAGLSIDIADSIYEAGARPGQVMESWPRAGTTVKPGRTVYVTINAFSPRTVTLGQSLVDISSRQAVAYLQALGVTDIDRQWVPGEFDDLVTAVTVDGRPLTVGKPFPVTARVTLRITRVPTDTPESDAVEEALGTEEPAAADDGNPRLPNDEPEALYD